MNSRLALGTAQFGLKYGVANNSGRIVNKEASKILLEASRVGIDTLDTAISYGDSESVLGELGVDRWSVVTKLPEVPDSCVDVEGWVEDQVGISLNHLGISQLHGVLLHRPMQLLSARGDALYGALERLKRLGYCRKIGVSIYDPSELDRLSKMRFDLIQAPLNILDRRLVTSGAASRLKNDGVELHVRSVFLQGLLLMPMEKRPPKFARWSPIWAEWQRWLNETSLSPVEACLRYVMSIDAVDKVVVGVDGVAQFREICSATRGSLRGLPDWPESIDSVLLNPALWEGL